MLACGCSKRSGQVLFIAGPAAPRCSHSRGYTVAPVSTGLCPCQSRMRQITTALLWTMVTCINRNTGRDDHGTSSGSGDSRRPRRRVVDFVSRTISERPLYIYTHIYICGCTYSNVCAGRCYESRQTYKLQLVARSLHLPEHPPPQMFVSSYLPDSLATSCYSHVLHLELFLVAWDTILTSLSHGFH